MKTAYRDQKVVKHFTQNVKQDVNCGKAKHISPFLKFCTESEEKSSKNRSQIAAAEKQFAIKNQKFV